MKLNIPNYHSLKKEKYRISAFLLAALLTTMFPSSVKAQMFSVGSERGPRYNTPQSEVYLGFEPMDVTYEGGNTDPAKYGIFAFNGPIIRVGYNSSSLNLFIGTGGKITGIDEVSYFDVGGNIDLKIPLSRSPKFSIQIPVRISSRFTRMTNSKRIAQQFNQFRLGNLNAGAGAQIMVRLRDNVRLELNGIPSYGFSFTPGGFFGGSMAAITAEGRLYFDHIFNNIGLTAGYRYDLRNYNVDENAYDYRMRSQSIQLGITF